ncbi:MAG: hypothetical protein DRJ15_15770, partial [Bacteroidetes bacterium]
KLQLDIYFNAFNNFKKLPVMERETEEYEVTHYGFKEESIVYLDGPFRIRTYLQKPKKFIIMTREGHDDPKEYSDYTFNYAARTAAIKYLNNFIEYSNKKDRIDKLKTELSICDI